MVKLSTHVLIDMMLNLTANSAEQFVDSHQIPSKRPATHHVTSTTPASACQPAHMHLIIKPSTSTRIFPRPIKPAPLPARSDAPPAPFPIYPLSISELLIACDLLGRSGEGIKAEACCFPTLCNLPASSGVWPIRGKDGHMMEKRTGIRGGGGRLTGALGWGGKGRLRVVLVLGEH